jgi:hypothetical protein
VRQAGGSVQAPRCGQHLIGPGSHPNVFGEVSPAHNPGGIDQKFGGSCNVVPVHARTRMQQVIAANHRSVRIGENGERIARFAGKVARDLGRVDADRYRVYTGCLELGQTFLDSS